MADTLRLLEAAQERGVRFRLSGDELQFRVLQELDGDTEALIYELRRNKQRVRALLAGNDQVETDNRPEEPTNPTRKDDPILRPEQWFPVFRALLVCVGQIRALAHPVFFPFVPS